jgi:hypothetical protein
MVSSCDSNFFTRALSCGGDQRREEENEDLWLLEASRTILVDDRESRAEAEISCVGLPDIDQGTDDVHLDPIRLVPIVRLHGPDLRGESGGRGGEGLSSHLSIVERGHDEALSQVI